MEEHKVNISQKTLIFREDGKFLTVFRTKTAPIRPNSWDLPGGVFEYGENPKESAKREILEETALKVGELEPITLESEVHENGVCVVTVAYKTKYEGGEVKLSFEHNDFKWVTPNEFLELKSSPKWKKIIKDFII